MAATFQKTKLSVLTLREKHLKVILKETDFEHLHESNEHAFFLQVWPKKILVSLMETYSMEVE